LAIVAYLVIGFLFALYAWSAQLQSFTCFAQDEPHSTIGMGGMWENPDPERCTRDGFELQSVATLPYFTVAWPIVITGKLINEQQHKPLVDTESPQTNNIVYSFDITESDTPEGWYLRRGEGFGDSSTVFFTKDPDVPWPQYELGELGEYISVNVRDVTGDPKQWVENYALCDDVLAYSCMWSFTNGRYHLQVKHNTPAADAQTDYFVDQDRVAIATLYPLDSDRETKVAYTRFLYNTVAPLVGTEYSRDVLRGNCMKEIPRELIDDSTADYENGVVMMYWWDGEAQENKSLTVPYEPETDFEGCSNSVKAFLEHLPGPIDKDTQLKNIDKYLAIDETLETIESSVCDVTSFQVRRITIDAVNVPQRLFELAEQTPNEGWARALCTPLPYLGTDKVLKIQDPIAFPGEDIGLVGTTYLFPWPSGSVFIINPVADIIYESSAFDGSIIGEIGTLK